MSPIGSDKVTPSPSKMTVAVASPLSAANLVKSVSRWVLPAPPRTLDEHALGLLSDRSGDCLVHLGSNFIGADAQLVNIFLKHLSELEREDRTLCRHDIGGQGRRCRCRGFLLNGRAVGGRGRGRA